MHNATNTNWALFALIGIAIIYIITIHGVHLLAYLPFSFLLGCLFMHMFMHSGHNNHTDDKSRDHHNYNH